MKLKMVKRSFQQVELGQWHMIFSLLLHVFIFGVWQRLTWWLNERNQHVLDRKPISDYYEHTTIIVNIVALTAGAILIRLGRKLAFFYTSFCQGLVMVAILYISVGDFVQYYFTMTEGAVLMVTSCLIGEYIHPNHRTGTIFLQISILYLGNAMSSILNEYFSYEAIAGTSLFFQLMSIMCLVFTKDVEPFACKRETVEYESVVENGIVAPNKITYVNNHLMKPIVIIGLSFILSEASGRNTYAIINHLKFAMTDITYTYYRDLSFSLAFMVSTIFLMKNGNLRTLIFTTGPASVSVMCLASILSFVKPAAEYIQSYEIAVSYLLAIYSVMAVLACTHLPVVLISEIIPMKYKCSSLFLSNILGFLIIQLNIRSFPHLMIIFKLYVVLILSVLVIIMCLLVLYFILPETKGRTLKEIESRIVSRGVNMCSQTVYRNQ